jgi:PIN domain nuclease of toxin-antitoxin system
MVLLDTHVLLWWQAGGRRLSQTAARAIAKAEAVLVSSISCWEVAALLAKGHIDLDRDVFIWVRNLFETDGIELAPLSPQAAVAAGQLGLAGFHGDPADRFLYATARELVVPLVTKDTTIRQYAKATKDVRVIW